MKLIKNDYVIEGTPKEINEFLRTQDTGEKPTESYEGKYIVTEDTIVSHVKATGMFGMGWYKAPKGTILEYSRKAYITNTAGTYLRPVFKDKNGVEIKVSLSDIKKYKSESMEDIMEKPLKELIEMAKSVCEMENKI
ncbi:hypothetical protein [Mammaliicoccus sciuri]|uniref:hypothetical protein n=1 Tax=Mammaliicoccus sciuri TaxID=1296 RepID=UPI002B258752|nr:hypothetical protein [Mammaliicoccus sciuri]WQK75238.1 hypothetical protein P3U33_05770 [Mammaliicoccus sciuri]